MMAEAYDAMLRPRGQPWFRVNLGSCDMRVVRAFEAMLAGVAA